jgi:hypothetical protein
MSYYYTTSSSTGTMIMPSTYGSGLVTYAPSPPPAPVKAAPRQATNLTRLHDRVEATCAKARLAA